MHIQHSHELASPITTPPPTATTGHTSPPTISSDGQSNTTQLSLAVTQGASQRQQLASWHYTQTLSTTSEASSDKSQWAAASVSTCRGHHPSRQVGCAPSTLNSRPCSSQGGPYPGQGPAFDAGQRVSKWRMPVKGGQLSGSETCHVL
jgi:hypothetical protein